MSIYRKSRPHYSDHDVRVHARTHAHPRRHAAGSHAAAVVPLYGRPNVHGAAVPAPLPGAKVIDWRAHRRAQPADVLLPMTRAWAGKLPEALRPVALLSAFPRVANQVAASWDDAPACAALLEDLIVDRRGNRRGFPPEVHADLLDLWRAFAGADGAMQVRRR